MDNKFRYVTECRCCGSDKLVKFLDLGTQPLANSYTERPEDLPEYPLAVNVCTTCWHTQLTGVVHPDELFKNYLYVSGTSKTLRDYFDWFAAMVSEKVAFRPNLEYQPLRVLDIACNDGSQLDSFARLGYETYGVDPAENLVPVARSKGHKVECAYWGHQNDDNLADTYDVIVAQNVFAHTDNILEFLEECRFFMRETSRVYIQTSQANMYRNGEFDTIYHEHLSFFSVRSMMAVAKRAHLHVIDVMKTPIHGTSFVFELSATHPTDQQADKLRYILEEEREAGLWNLSSYNLFGERAQQTVLNLYNEVETFRSMGLRVVGYGAAAKGMTVLNFGKIKLDYIVDDNPLKHGRYTPGMKIPIFDRSLLKNDDLPRVVVPLAWNFFDEIKKNVDAMELMPKPKFIKYFPTVEVI